MIERIKKIMYSFLSKRIDAYFEQKFTFGNKWGIIIDSSSYFQIPLQIDGGQHIKIGNNSTIGKYAWLGAFTSYLPGDFFTPKISIGNNTRIGNYVCITCIDNISIGDGVLISEYFYASDHFHGMNPNRNISPLNRPLEVRGNGVKIGNNCFIGYRVSVLPGVTLGKNCVVGSHSVVTKSFPDNCMVTGIPAKLIKTYDFDKEEWIPIN